MAALLAPHACGRAADTAGERGAIVSTRTAVFLLADSASLEALGSRHPADDFAVIADDMMWYRAEAWTWLEERGVPVITREGRPTLRFRVEGAAREFRFAGDSLLDVVVLYDADREPLAVAPIDVPTAAASYFADLPAAGAASPH